MLFKIRNGVLVSHPKITDGTVIIPSHVKKIGESAFEQCHGLTKLILPERLQEIGEYAFAGCEALTEVIFQTGKFPPKKPLRIKDRAFSGCESLVIVSIPEHLSEIGSFAFFGCSMLKRLAPPSCTEDGITLPEGFASLGAHAFAECSAVPELRIPFTLQSCGKQAVRSCIGLKEITLQFPDGSMKRFPAYGTETDYMLDVLIKRDYSMAVSSVNVLCLLGSMLDDSFYGESAAAYLAEHPDLFYADAKILKSIVNAGLLPVFLNCDAIAEKLSPADVEKLLDLLKEDKESLARLILSEDMKDFLHSKCIAEKSTAQGMESLLIHILGMERDREICPRVNFSALLRRASITNSRVDVKPQKRNAAKLQARLEHAGIVKQLPAQILEKLAILANENKEYELQVFWMNAKNENGNYEGTSEILKRLSL